MLPHLALDNYNHISIFSLGTVKFGRNTAVKYPQNFDLPSDKKIQNILAFIKEKGINCLDTAPAYGNSEQRIGELLRHRQDWLISSKVGEIFENGNSYFDYSTVGVIKSIDRSLTNLKTDYIDIIFIHSNGEDLKILEQTDIINTLNRLKLQGKVKLIGMSSKTYNGAIQSLKYFDLLMLTHNILLSDDNLNQNRNIIRKAQSLNKSVLIKKAFASGYIFQKSQKLQLDNLKLIYSNPAVKSIVLGSINIKNIQYNLDLFEQASLNL